jgi:small conductance mechanosensitive channel
VDLDKALQTIREVLRHNPRVCPEPAPVVGVNVLDESAIRIAIRPWVKVSDFVDATGELNGAIVAAFRKSRIEIPLPQREIRMLAAAGPAPS